MEKRQPKSLEHDPTPREGSPSPRLEEREFRRRFPDQFQDPAYEPLSSELNKIVDAAWDAYSHQRKSPKTRKAGPGFVDPDYDLSTGWIAASDAIRAARARHDEPDGKPRILVVNGEPQ